MEVDKPKECRLSWGCWWKNDDGTVDEGVVTKVLRPGNIHRNTLIDFIDSFKNHSTAKT